MEGAFVYGDSSTTTDIQASADNQFLVRATGGVYFYTSSNLSTGAFLPAGDSTWSTVSDRNAKTAFEPVDPDEVLDCLAGMEIEKWSYKGSKIRHMWPVAQDFYACYGLGVDNKHVTAEDMAGVAMVSIQALNARDQEQQGRIQALNSKVKELQQENADLKARLERLERLIEGGAQ
jgi:hypothetical protein